MSGWLRTSAVALLAIMWCQLAQGHEVRPVIATVGVADGGEVRLDVSLNLEAVLVGIGTAHTDTQDSPQADAYERLRALPAVQLERAARARIGMLTERFQLSADGNRVPLELVGVEVPTNVDAALSRISKLAFSGRLPPAADTYRWRVHAAVGNSVIRVRAPGGAEVVASEFVLSGRQSRPFPVAGGATSTALSVFWQYLQVGFVHIVPRGLDHILFVLGLFLLSTRLTALLAQVTAFTVAHTVTLGLGMAELVQLPATAVEPLIAASIVYVAVENLVTSRVHSWRLILVFGFGLLHGLGFAGVLAEIGPATERFVLSLVAFNLGVEGGQLAVIAAAFAALGWAASHVWYRPRVVIPLSLAVGLVGAWWFVERVAGALGGGA